MQIQQIQVDNTSHHRDLTVEDLTSGFNLIYGLPASGKTRVAEFVHGLLFGHRGAGRDAVEAWGSAVVSTGMGRYRVQRRWMGDGTSTVSATPYDSHTPTRSAESVFPGVSERLYERVFQVSFRKGYDIDSALAEAESAMHRSSSDLTEVRELETQLAGLQVRRREWLHSDQGESPLDRVARRRDALREEITRSESHWTKHMGDVRRRQEELDQLVRIREGALADANRRIDGLEAQMSAAEAERKELIQRYENLQRNTDLELAEEIQGKLQKITEQMLRWNRVLSDVLERRDRIRAELVDWATGGGQETDLGESARRIASMEQLIHDLKVEIKRFRKSDRAVTHCGCGKIHSSCKDGLNEIRDHLSELCEDLSREQYKYRRNALNGELKQLRRCHGEVVQYLERLVKRRNELLRRLGDADPSALSEAIREQCELCEAEDSESLFDLVSVKSMDVAGDWDDVQRRLGDLDYQIEELRSKRLEAGREAEEHRENLSSVRSELSAIANDTAADALAIEKRLELQRFEHQYSILARELEVLNEEVANAESRLERLRGAEHATHLLSDASQWLRDLTGNELIAISRGARSNRIVVENRAGRITNWEELTQQNRDLTHLAVCLAAASALHKQGVHCPLVLDDLFAHIDDDRVSTVAGVLRRHSEMAGQILATTGWDAAAARCETAGVTVRRLTSSHAIVAEPRTGLDDIDGAASRAPLTVEDTDSVAQPTFGDGIPDDTYYLERTDPIDETPDLDHEQSAALRTHGIDTVGEFLNVTIEDLSRWSDVRLSSVELKRCQSMADLLCDVINLRPYDVRILVGAGIQNASQLRRMTSEQLLSRVEGYIGTLEGRAILVSGDDFELARVANWIRSARESREFHRETERQQALRQAKARSRASGSNRLTVYSANGSRDSNADRGKERYHSLRKAASNAAEARTSGQRASASRSASRRSSSPSRPEQISRSSRRSGSSDGVEFRFHLSRQSDVEAAPSIGPKMASHLAKVGIVTVGDLLGSDAAQIAEDLDHRRVNSETVRLWQRQAEWVCRVPEIRGHDAQLLVASGYETVEDLNGVEVDDLFEIVDSIVRTKEGKRILRGGNRPDHAEIADWLQWAKHSRKLIAA